MKNIETICRLLSISSLSIKLVFRTTLTFLLVSLFGSLAQAASSSASSLPSASSSSLASSSSSSASSVVVGYLKVRVNGLNLGKTLVLKNNGGDPLTITRNVHYYYKFSQPLNYGTSFSVTVDQKPAEQTCSVSPASGVMGAANTDMLFVTCTNNPTASVQVSTEGYPEQPLQLPLGSAGIRNKAYPNILYESRIGVKGGIFPYEFRIDSLTKNGVPVSSNGMSIDFRKGTLRWTPTEAGNYVVTVKVKDSRASSFIGNAEITQSFPIEVSQSKFSFVDYKKGVDATTSGAINKPYKTIAYAMTHAPLTNSVYVRKGVHPLGQIYLQNSSPTELLAYPNERVILDQQFSSQISINGPTLVARVEGFEMINVRQYSIYLETIPTGLVVRNNRFVNGREYYPGEVVDGYRKNPGYIYATAGDDHLPRHHNIMVQENYFGAFELIYWPDPDTGELEISGGSTLNFFTVKDAIVENNLSETNTENGFNDKDSSQFNTFRENAVLKATGQGIHIMGQHGAKGVDVHHNLLIGSGINIGLQCGADIGCYMEDTYVHHNTLIDGNMTWWWGLINSGRKNFQFYRNVISNSKGSPHFMCQDQDVTEAFAQAHVDRNIYVTPPLLIMDNDWCAQSNDADRNKWQNVLGFDLNGIFTTSSPLIGSSTVRQLKSTSPYYLLYGHIYN